MATWLATEFWAEIKRDVGISITPVADGRIEVLLDGEMLYDRKAEGGAYPEVTKMRQIRRAIKEKLEALTPAPAN